MQHRIVNILLRLKFVFNAMCYVDLSIVLNKLVHYIVQQAFMHMVYQWSLVHIYNNEYLFLYFGKKH